MSHKEGSSTKTSHRIRRTSSETKDVHEDEHHILHHKKGISKPTHRTSPETKDVHHEGKHTLNKTDHVKSTHRTRRTSTETKDVHDEGKHTLNKTDHVKSTHRIRRTSTEAKDVPEEEKHIVHKKESVKTTHRVRKKSSHTKDVTEEEQPLDNTVSDKQIINEFCWTTDKAKNESAEKNPSSEEGKSEVINGFRWVAEFMAGPGGFLEKTEVVSEWFETLDVAKNNACDNADNEISDYPFSRGNILKLIVEDKNGNEIELRNVTKDN